MSWTSERIRLKEVTLRAEPDVVETPWMREKVGEDIADDFLEAARAHPQLLMAMAGILLENWGERQSG